MKHIKIFETFKRPYKKYLIVRKPKEATLYYDYNEEYDFYIIKFDKKYNNKNFSIILGNFIFGYSNNENYKHLNSKKYQFDIDKLHILYQSDKLYDCKEQIKTYSTANKYNL